MNSARQDFWKHWKNKTKIEKKAIKSTEKARELVINAVPKNKLVAIYLKGSFARREMKKGSDVDMVPIVAENRYQSAVFGVNDCGIDPVIVVPLSLWELEHNRLWTKSDRKPDLRAKPDRLLKMIKEYKLIYGHALNPKKYPIQDDVTALKDKIRVIKNGYVPHYEKDRIKFDTLLKEVFWLTELEQNALGKKVRHSFAGIARAVGEPEHIIHDALNLRRNPSKHKEKIFVSKLKRHLEELEKRLNRAEKR
jgi:predicted nucleotidyltransferase